MARQLSADRFDYCRLTPEGIRSDDLPAADREIRHSELAGRLKVFRNPETHPAAHYRLTEIGIRPMVAQG
jgi:hypothetical protein